ncbi:hypothetical protein HRbin36_01734 [bacterium HR36]|nr:hypothetical protein HRbin36_01734 [bacterium HR36]
MVLQPAVEGVQLLVVRWHQVPPELSIKTLTCDRQTWELEITGKVTAAAGPKPKLLLPYGRQRELVPGDASHLDDEDVIQDVFLNLLQAPSVWIIDCRVYTEARISWQRAPKHWELLSSHAADLLHPGSSDVRILHYQIHKRPASGFGEMVNKREETAN